MHITTEMDHRKGILADFRQCVHRPALVSFCEDIDGKTAGIPRSRHNTEIYDQILVSTLQLHGKKEK